MTSQEFVNQLKKDIQAFPKIRIKHPFLKAVCNGTATMDQIRAWAIQDYQFRAAVPRIAMEKAQRDRPVASHSRVGRRLEQSEVALHRPYG